MVVCMIVRIRNATASRTFTLAHANDPFYTPCIGGTPCGSELVELPPGFDEATDGLVVPWLATSRQGLVFGEVDSLELVRCSVGPREEGPSDIDWLQFHDTRWEPIVQPRWLALGHRHVLGMMGEAVELQLTFHDTSSLGEVDTARRIIVDGHSGYAGLSFAEHMHFDQEITCAAPNTVFLNVFDLAAVASLPNAMLCNTLVKTIGAFHAAVEVYGDEWSFYKQASPSACGVGKSLLPRHHSVHVYRQSVNLGPTRLKDWEVMRIIESDVIPNWPSGRYDLIHCNCIHFCDSLLALLGAKPVPPWVRGLHETGAAILRFPSSLFGHSGFLGITSDSTDVIASQSEAAEDSSGGGDANDSRRSSAADSRDSRSFMSAHSSTVLLPTGAASSSGNASGQDASAAEVASAQGAAVAVPIFEQPSDRVVCEDVTGTRNLEKATSDTAPTVRHVSCISAPPWDHV
eukprot:TRINITY_DN44479_c0_g1_i1.p1 TRINITY_DN44479_c0_g1~~TRINITY_DN44479_c0_g1_i1.p1  ORF type:complete len:460 (-),score=57.64 TRINITY_DN44479_c0_g1_i1:164-1543(-)